MRVAVCLHGYYGTVSTGDFSTSTIGFQHIKETILSKVDNVDFYVHCWQPECKKEIVKVYNPVCCEFEEQIDFDKICAENKIYQNYFDEHFPRKKTMYKNANASRILSFYYSRCKSLKMSLDKDYDWILTTRFDISARGGKEVNQIRFLIDQDKEYLYTTDWQQKNVGYGDMWFYGSPSIMRRYSDIYTSALNDFRPLSRYEKIATTGWPDSNYFNVHDFNDQRQFTNEIDKQQKSINLMKFPKWRVTDSHLYHKWFCMQNGLYEKTRWV
tara:strand:+ start:495 stop:1304 length:810 start_codon:yes stop_codon:yes gene_type:complete